ncbi:zinc finger, CCHC-type containing protein [Tanacetum coccineum]
MTVAAMKHMASNFTKLDKFEGVDFRRWQKKMHFLLSCMSVVYMLDTSIPKDGENATMKQIRRRNKWENDDYVCRGLILNDMFDPLFDIYQNVESSKELWDSLEAKYMTEDASSNKFLVSCIIEKLPSSWKDFKHTLKHQKEELTLVELGTHLRIEESLMMKDNDKPKGNNVVGPSVVNIVEHNNSSRYTDNRGKHKHQDTKADPNKKSKVTCWKCGKHGHLKKDYNRRKVGNKANGPDTNGSVNGSSNLLKGTLTIGANVKHQDTKAYPNKKSKVTCWKCEKPRHLKKDCKGGKISYKANGSCTNGSVNGFSNSLKDSGATVHVCKDRCWFKTHESLNDGTILHMRNESTTMMHGRGCVDLRFSSGKIVSLFNVLHIPNIRKNLVSSSILNNYGYKQVTESTKFVLSKHGVFIGFGYLSNQILRLNIINDNIGLAFISTSKLNDLIIWHAKLCHVHFKRMQDMSKAGLIPTFDMDTKKLARRTSINVHFSSHQLFDQIAQQKYKDDDDDDDDDELEDLKTEENDELLLADELSEDCDVDVDDHETKALVFMDASGFGVDFGRGVGFSGRLVRWWVLLLVVSFDGVGEIPVVMVVVNNPKTFDEAMNSHDVAFWKEAINDEMDSILGKNTWVLADLPSGCKPLGHKWILKRKLKVDGTIENFKARLVIQGFRQKSRIDYFDTYAPVALGKLILEGYTDASWINNTEENSSTSGWVFLLGRAAGNAATLAKAYSQMYNGKSRHLGVKHSMIHELIMNGVVSIEFVRSQQNLVDHLTKGLTRDLVLKSAEEIGLKSNQVTEC